MDVASADGDVEALSALIDDKLPKGAARLLHAGNEEARGDLTGRLRSAGFSAEFLAIFRAVANPTPGPVLQGHLAGPPGFEAVLVHRRAAQPYSALRRAELPRWMWRQFRPLPLRRWR